MLLTIANLDRMGPTRPKNPHRISIWAYEVSIACSQCLKPEPVVQPPGVWKRIFSRENSLPIPSPTKSHSAKRSLTSPIKMPSLRRRPSVATTTTKQSRNSYSHSPPTSPNTLSSSATENTLTLTLSNKGADPSHPLFSSLPVHLPSNNNSDEMSRTAMYASGHDAEWAVDDWGEDDNGESSLDMASSESGAGWGARDRAQRLDRAERLLNTNDKKTRMAAMRQATALTVGVGA